MKKKIFILCLLIICLGCASAPEKPTAPSMEVFYPPLPQRPRLQFLQTIAGQSDLGPRQSTFREFLAGKPQDRLLGKPYDVGAAKGKIYVLDRMNKLIVILDLAARQISFLNDRGSGRLGDPAGIWVSPENVKYVADMQRKQVLAFDENDQFIKAYGGPDLFARPVDVVSHGERIYVVDMEMEQLFVLDRETGRLVQTVGAKGDLFKPSHVTVGPTGHVYVTDALHFLIKKYSADGSQFESIGFHGDQLGGFARPKGAAVDKSGRLYVVDAAFENVQIFDNQGRILLHFAGPGTGPGDLYLPSGIAIDYDNVAYFQKFADPDFKLDYLIYVTSMFGNNMLNVYGYGHWSDEAPSGD